MNVVSFNNAVVYLGLDKSNLWNNLQSDYLSLWLLVYLTSSLTFLISCFWRACLLFYLFTADHFILLCGLRFQWNFIWTWMVVTAWSPMSHYSNLGSCCLSLLELHWHTSSVTWLIDLNLTLFSTMFQSYHGGQFTLVLVCFLRLCHGVTFVKLSSYQGSA